jgi:hypothetical protein
MILENLRNEKGVRSSLPAHGRVGARATPLFSAAHFAEQKTNVNFLLLQNTKSGGEFLKSEIPNPKPARIPLQTPPAGGNTAEVLPNPFPQKNCFGKTESISVFRVFRKMGSDFFKQTPPFQICRRSCLGASPLGIGFRQEIPGGFEFRQKHSRRKSAVPKRSLDCAFSARADE